MYPFNSVYKQERKLYNFHQNDIKNRQWHDKFNTRSDVANDIGVTIQHKVLFEHMDQGKQSDSIEKSQENNKK